MLDRPEETARLPEKMARCRRFIRLAALGTFSQREKGSQETRAEHLRIPWQHRERRLLDRLPWSEALQLLVVDPRRVLISQRADGSAHRGD